MDFRDLDVWNLSMDLVEDVYKVTKALPKSEMFGLTDQMRRASVSIPSNIAEGNGRQHSREYINFLYIALGSLLELITQTELARRLDYISSEQSELIIEKCTRINKMLRALIRAIKKDRIR
jgi:four helix bundle protein